MEINKMPIQVIWDNEDKTIIRVTFPEKWTWDEFQEIDYRVETMIDRLQHKVVYLADISATQSVPKGLKLDVVRYVLDFNHENSDLLVVVGMNKMVKAMFDIVTLALGHLATNIKTADTLEEGYQLLNYRLLEIERGG